MTAGELEAVIAVSGKHLSEAQRILVARFVGALVTHGNGEIARHDRNRREAEKAFEEREIARTGAGDAALSRRSREPA